eukprot:2333733-Prymnesium_polylepis.1
MAADRDGPAELRWRQVCARTSDAGPGAGPSAGAECAWRAALARASVRGVPRPRVQMCECANVRAVLARASVRRVRRVPRSFRASVPRSR